MKRRHTKYRLAAPASALALFIATLLAVVTGPLAADGFPDLLGSVSTNGIPALPAQSRGLSAEAYAISFAAVYSNRDAIQRREQQNFLRELDASLDQTIHEKRREEAAWQAPRIQTSEPTGHWEGSLPLPTSSSIAAAGPRATPASGSKIIRIAPRHWQGAMFRINISGRVPATVSTLVRIDYYSLRNGYIPDERSHQILSPTAHRLTFNVTPTLSPRDATDHLAAAFQSHFNFNSTRPDDFSVKSQVVGFFVFRGSDHAFIPA